jgi:hypothetical protein
MTSVPYSITFRTTAELCRPSPSIVGDSPKNTLIRKPAPGNAAPIGCARKSTMQWLNTNTPNNKRVRAFRVKSDATAIAPTDQIHAIVRPCDHGAGTAIPGAGKRSSPKNQNTAHTTSIRQAPTSNHPKGTEGVTRFAAKPTPVCAKAAV